MRYQTEIYVPGDRYVCLQLPDYLPEGRALVTVTVTVLSGELAEGENFPPDPEGDRNDIEWWDEFDEEVRDRS